MNLNQTTIKKHLEDIHADITKYLPQIITYRAEVKQAEATYTPEYAEQSKKRSFEKLAAAAQNTRDSIQRHIALRPWSWNISRLWKKFRPRWR